MPQSLHQSNPRTITAVLRHQAEMRPHAPALLAPERPSMAYGDLWRQTCAFGATLRRCSIGKGHRVGLVMPNGAESASAFLGIASHATCVPLNPDFRRSEFERDIRCTRVRLLVTGADTPAELKAAATATGVPVLNVPLVAGGCAGALEFESEAGSSFENDAAPQHVAMLIQTSGTSGRQKIVPLTHANLVASSANLASHLAIDPSDRCLNVMPLFHSHALRGALLTSLYSGASVICAPGFRPDKILSWLRDLGATWYTAVPTIHQSVLAALGDTGQDVTPPRLRFVRSTSSALPPATLHQLEAALLAPVIESYGMTECSVICINPLPPAERRFGSVGLATNIDVRIADESGIECARGTIGQIMVRGPRVFDGYESNDAANAAAFVDGWFKTGDLARQDSEGYVYVTGRADELVNRGGLKIAPREVDDVLQEHVAVAHAVVFGVPHATLGQDLVAAVVLHPSRQVDEQMLRAHLSDRLVDSKIPSTIIFLDEIPKGAIGKVQRNQLHLMLADQLRRAYVAPRNSIEESIVAVFGGVLQQPHVGVFDNFFSLGGDSLSGATAMARINREHAVTLPAATLFQCPTVATLAAKLTALKSQEEERELRMQAEIADLTDEEVIRLFAQEELKLGPTSHVDADVSTVGESS